MKRLVLVLLVLFLLFTVVEAASADGYYSYNGSTFGTSIAHRVSLREAPDENSHRYKYLNNNEDFEVVGETGDWYVINYPDAKSGVAYALKDYIVINPIRIILLERAPVYSSPRRDKRIGYVGSMEEFLVIEEYGDFFVVNIREASGFLLKSTPHVVVGDIERYYNIVPRTGFVIKSNSLNVRLGPGSKYTSIGRLREGNKVKIVDKFGDWYAIIYTYKNRQIVAYVMAKYIQ